VAKIAGNKLCKETYLTFKKVITEGWSIIKEAC
jgi:hypothetical protein